RHPLGQGQLLYVVFLWWMVTGNLMRAVPPFHEQRLITEGVIHVNAVICTMLVLLWPAPVKWPDRARLTGISLTVQSAVGLSALALSVMLFWQVVRQVHGDTFVGHGGYHVRFGADAKTGKPDKDRAHP